MKISLNRTVTLAFLSGLSLAALCSGCSLRNDPDYNVYENDRAAKPALQHAEDAIGFVEQILDNLDRRMENAVY